MKQWNKASWRKFPIKQQPKYENLQELQDVEKRLSTLPPLIFAGEVRNLKEKLKDVTLGKAFLLQGGDCAESFNNFSANNIRDLFKLMMQMAIVLTYSGQKPVVKVGRIAGQFAKPRSSDYEEINSIKLPSYRGDIINDMQFNELSRVPDASRMIQAYNQAASTHNLIRAFSRGGLADLHTVSNWNLGFVKNYNIENKYHELAQRLKEALIFMENCGITTSNTPQINQTSLYSSHEALLLNYEEALTRQDSLSGDWYDCSAHMLWIGERTRDINDAHVEFLRGVKNPIGVKISDNASCDDILNLCDKLNPQNEAGRLNIIIRMGAEKIKEKFPSILRGVKKEDRQILWSIDPMHGNTIKANGYKTREYDKIFSEIKSFFQIHKSENTIPGGVHLEMTGQDVTECIGGIKNVTQEILGNRYETQCDPRLNADQALELAFAISELLKQD